MQSLSTSHDDDSPQSTVRPVCAPLHFTMQGPLPHVTVTPTQAPGLVHSTSHLPSPQVTVVPWHADPDEHVRLHSPSQVRPVFRHADEASQRTLHGPSPHASFVPWHDAKLSHSS